MTSILFVVRSYSRTGAQPIRFRQILHFLSRDFDIHVLELSHNETELRHEDSITIHSLRYSFAGRLLNPAEHNVTGMPGKKRILSRPVTILKRMIKWFIFPDSIITESSRLKRESLKLAGELKCNAVVLSAFPFTTLICARSLKKLQGIKTVLDIGDPFYKNSKNGFFKDIFAHRFEKHYLRYIDLLVVTNEITRSHYLSVYPDRLQPDQIRVIEQGVSPSFISGTRKEQSGPDISGDKGVFNLVYAGQLYKRFREPYELFRAVLKANSLNSGDKIILNMYGSFNRQFVDGFDTTDKIVFHGQVKYDRLLDIYSGANAIVFIDNAFGLQTPGKIYEIALLGKPVLFITDRDDSPALGVVKELNHFVITANKAEKIVSAINNITKSEFSFQTSLPETVFLWENRASQYKQALMGLIYGSAS